MNPGRTLKYLLVFITFVSASTVLWRSRTSAQGTASIVVTPATATSLTIGSTFGWTSTITNNSSGSLTLGAAELLTYPDGAVLSVPPATKFSALAAGKSTSGSVYFTTSAFTSQTGVFTLQVNAEDPNHTVYATSTITFDVLPLPAGLIPAEFSDIAASAGVNITHHFANSMCKGTGVGLPQGTGAGWADYDNDGLLDLFVTDFNGNSHLYKNNGNQTFTDVTAAAGLPASIPFASGVTWADYDNDGYPDLLVLTDGTPYLFHNNGNGTFTDVSTASGLTSESGRGESAAWGDFDSDGYLDLYIVNYGECASGGKIAAQASHLFHNNRDGTFTDVTSYMGGTSNKALQGHGFVAVWFDFNNDNRPDLYVANDRFLDPNRTGDVLWRNDGPDGKGGWIFTNVSAGSNVNQVIAAMGIAVGDFNRDGYFDLAYSNTGQNFLQQNKQGNGTFQGDGQSLGAQRAYVPNGSTYQTSITWGLGLADLNNDGWEDLFIAGGKISGGTTSIPNAVLLNNLAGRLTGLSTDNGFLDLSYLSGTGNAFYFNRTAALGDLDGDGWMDVYVVPWNGVAQLYHNNGAAQGNTNHWLEVSLAGTASNRDGVGAKLTLTAGGENQYRMIFSGTSLGAGSQVAAHFGLGSATTVDNLQILWPSGTVQNLTSLAADQHVAITEGSSQIRRIRPRSELNPSSRANIHQVEKNLNWSGNAKAGRGASRLTRLVWRAPLPCPAIAPAPLPVQGRRRLKPPALRAGFPPHNWGAVHRSDGGTRGDSECRYQPAGRALVASGHY